MWERNNISSTEIKKKNRALQNHVSLKGKITLKVITRNNYILRHLNNCKVITERKKKDVMIDIKK